MRWEDRFLALFDDLEQQAEGLALADRDAEVAERGRAEYAQVDLAARLHASTGSRVALGVAGVGQLEASLVRVGADWLLVTTGGQEWVVRFAALTSVRGLSARAVSEPARPLTARLALGSALREVAEGRAPVVLHRTDGSVLLGVVRRVGADFLEVTVERTRPGEEVLPFGQLAAVRTT
jgi:hypothetical protein